MHVGLQMHRREQLRMAVRKLQSQLPSQRLLREWVYALWACRYKDVPLMTDEEFKTEAQTLALDWTYSSPSGVWVSVNKKGKDGKKRRSRVQVMYILASVIGHTGRVVATQLVPTEKWDHVCPMLKALFIQMKQRGLPAPKVVWVDDWSQDSVCLRIVCWDQEPDFCRREVGNFSCCSEVTKWHSLLEDLVLRFWPEGGCTIGQDWFHFAHLMMTHVNRRHVHTSVPLFGEGFVMQFSTDVCL